MRYMYYRMTLELIIIRYHSKMSCYNTSQTSCEGNAQCYWDPNFEVCMTLEAKNKCYPHLTYDSCQTGCIFDQNQMPVCYPAPLVNLSANLTLGDRNVSCGNPTMSYNPKVRECTCQTVKYPTRVLSVDNKCVNNCGENQNIVDGKCLCNTGFTVSGNDCICDSAKVISVNGQICTDSCGVNQYADNNKRCQCKPTFTLTKDKNECECTAILSVSGDECVTTCPVGQEVVNNKCEFLDQSTMSKNSSSTNIGLIVGITISVLIIIAIIAAVVIVIKKKRDGKLGGLTNKNINTLHPTSVQRSAAKVI